MTEPTKTDSQEAPDGACPMTAPDPEKIEAGEALSRNRLLADEDGEVAAAHEEIDVEQLPADRWWWD